MKEESLSAKQYGAGDISKLLEIDRNRLFYWINTHRLLKPERGEADGTGTRAKFSLQNLLELAIIKVMDDNGMDLKRIRDIKKSLDKQFIKKYNETIYSYVLGAEDQVRENMALKIGQKGNKYSFEFTPLETEVEIDEDGLGNAYEIDMPFEPLETKDPGSGRMPFSQLLEIGYIANQVIEKLQKE